jgi:sortase A
VLAQPQDPNATLLTLTTCNPKRSTKQRLVIHSHLDAAASSAPGARTVNYRDPASTGATTATTPVTDALGASDDSTVVSPTVAGAPTSVPASSVAPTPTPATTVAATLPGPGGSDAKALARGWFNDSGAWPQLLAWGALLLLISSGAWWLGRRFGRRWLGPLVAATPFVVVLYFFFQNINRLLPPGL